MISAEALFPWLIKIFNKYILVLGWVEHDPKEILNAQLATVKMALEKAGAAFEEVASIGMYKSTRNYRCMESLYWRASYECYCLARSKNNKYL